MNEEIDEATDAPTDEPTAVGNGLNRTVEIELDENGRADLEIIEGTADVRSRIVLGGTVTTIDGEPGETVTMEIRGDTDDF